MASSIRCTCFKYTLQFSTHTEFICSRYSCGFERILIQGISIIIFVGSALVCSLLYLQKEMCTSGLTISEILPPFSRKEIIKAGFRSKHKAKFSRCEGGRRRRSILRFLGLTLGAFWCGFSAYHIIHHVNLQLKRVYVSVNSGGCAGTTDSRYASYQCVGSAIFRII